MTCQPALIYLTPHAPTVGAGLLAKAALQSTRMQDQTAHLSVFRQRLLSVPPQRLLTLQKRHSKKNALAPLPSIIMQQPRTILPITTPQPTATEIHLRGFVGTMVAKCLATA